MRFRRLGRGDRNSEVLGCYLSKVMLKRGKVLSNLRSWILLKTAAAASGQDQLCESKPFHVVFRSHSFARSQNTLAEAQGVSKHTRFHHLAAHKCSLCATASNREDGASCMAIENDDLPPFRCSLHSRKHAHALGGTACCALLPSLLMVR